jgi:adenine phosphoribosyltransferase
MTGPGPDPETARRLVADSLLAAEVMDRSGYPYLVHPLLDGVPRLDAHLLDAWAAWACDQPEAMRATVILVPEAMGIHLGAALSHISGLPMLVARKRAYGLPGEVALTVRTGYGQSTLHLSGLQKGDRVLVVDDVLSTGATLGAILGAIPKTGATALGALVVLDKGKSRGELEARHGIPVRAICHAEVTLKGIRLVSATEARLESRPPQSAAPAGRL